MRFRTCFLIFVLLSETRGGTTYSFSYDAIGNPTSWYDGSAMTWANGRRLASISATSDHGAMSFTYDADGLRLTKTAGGTEHRYLWQGGLLVSESWGSNWLEFYYDESGRPYALNYNGVVYYYITDLQGDVIKLVGGTGAVAAEYSYNAWGEVLSATGTMAAINPLRYRGYYYDSESGLYYLKSRYYDPALCRFINADGLASTGQGFTGTNMFAYCNDNPVVLLDVDGLAPVALWYYLLEASDIGFIHRCVQKEIVKNGMGVLMMEAGIVRADGSKGRADIVSSSGEVWEIKHANSIDTMLSIVLAENQALSYVGAHCAAIGGNINSLGPAGCFSNTFIINCMDRSYEVTYFTPSDGTILYTVKALERYEPQPDFVFSPSTAKENELKKAAVYSSIGFAIVKAAGALAHSWQREYVGKQVAALA